MDGHFQGRIIFLLGRFVFVVMLRAFLFIFTPQAQKVGTIDLKRSLCTRTGTSCEQNKHAGTKLKSTDWSTRLDFKESRLQERLCRS